MVHPRILCRKHLLGEHVENHMFVASMHKSLRGYVDNNLLELEALPDRHCALVREMMRRKYKHNSIFDMETYIKYFDSQSREVRESRVDRTEALVELLSRCPECYKRYENLSEYYRAMDT